MKTSLRSHTRTLLQRLSLPTQLLLICFVVGTVFAQTRPVDPRLQGEGTLKVMTYNMDVGTDYAGMLDPSLSVFLQASTNALVSIRASDPQARMEAIARQIVATTPHLVSLQEVATVSSGPTKDKLTLEFDYLDLLLRALSAQGAQYVTVSSFTTWDAIVPSTLGFIRNTWRVAFLARADLDPDDFSFTNIGGGKWTATFVAHLYALDHRDDLCPVPLRPSDGSCRMPWPRGWVSSDVFYRDKRFRIVGAHLDSASALLEIPQALELLSGPANTTLPVIVAADLNCDCSDVNDPMYATCLNFKKAGFIDSWKVAHPFEPGYTKYLPVLTKRSDYIMVRGRFRVQEAALVGEQVGDQTPTGLWPSDHAGVVARTQLPGVD